MEAAILGSLFNGISFDPHNFSKNVKTEAQRT